MKNETPEKLAGDWQAATKTAKAALHFFVYEQWHPDTGTKNFARVRRDFMRGVAIEDVLFARGVKVTGNVYGLRSAGVRY